MPINFTDSPSNGATQTIGGRTYTYNSAKNKWDTTATEVTGPTATVYASVDNLPTSGNITGSQAFVSGTNRLYIWNGSGWYNIALINTTPTISGASSSYALAIDGTATTVTLTATDPEGLPITYSIASDTSGNTATVTQGTGSNTNVFTITPSTNTAHAGTFSLTFRASDGVNLATAVSSFTLQFIVQNSRYTTALITSVGANNATNASFDDKSTSNHTITANGDAHQNTFSPYRHGGYSTYFDGTGDYITAPSNTSFDFGTGNFTIETWINIPDVTSTWLAFISRGYAQNGGWRLYKNTGNNNLRFYYTDSGTTSYIEASTTGLTNNTWHHIAVVRNSSTTKIYVDGVEKGSGTISTSLNPGSYAVEVGSGVVTSSFPITGYMTDVRIVKGTAVYTSAFTPPTERLTAVTNTSLLACHLPYFADGSTNGHTITVNGNTSIEPFAPFDYQQYIVGDNGGSAYFDGSGDYLQIPDSSTLDLPADFTVEFWMYREGDTSGTYQSILGGNGSSSNGWNFYITNSNNALSFFHSSFLITGPAIQDTRWYHVALTRSGTTLTMYVDGASVGTATTSTSFDQSTANAGTRIGYDNGANGYFHGYLTDVRVVQGTAVYTANFTPPTAPLTAITNTSLLLNMQGAKVIDKAQGMAKHLTLAGQTTASTAAYKYLPTSMYFDGNGDYIQLEGMDDRYYGDFTVEGWYKFNTYNSSAGANTRLFASRQGGNQANNLQILVAKATDSGSGGAGTISVYTNAYQITGSTVTVADNNWHHVAVSRQGTSLKLFVDGTHTGTTKTTSQSFLFWDTRLGTRDNTADATSKYTGYMSDVRITKGLARYTSNFTAPSAALQG